MGSYACYGWMMPATYENAQKLGIDDVQIKENIGDFDSELPPQDWWDEMITEAGYNSVMLKGRIQNKVFNVSLIHVSYDDEIDSEMDDNVTTYFTFSFDDLFETTWLYNMLENVGMKHCSWVTFG
jgi:hypothetical protein